MKKMMKQALFASVAVWAVGCGGQVPEKTGETQSLVQNLGPNKEFYGSDTLKEALLLANNEAQAGLTVEGKGSSVGEKCLRNGDGLYCNGRQQTLAPMSRDFKAGTCADGTPSNGACCPGESSNAVALDAVNAFVQTNNGITNLTTDQLRKIFFATDDKGVAIPGACPTDWSAVGRASGGPLVKYRRDDLSGTTDTFKSLLKGGTFCADVIVISDESASNPAPCTASDSATTCIGKLTEDDANAIGFSGSSAQRADNLAISINGVAPTTENVRKLVTGEAGVYPLSRQIFLNENKNFTKTAEEARLYNWIYQTNTADFESILVSQGFIACSEFSPLDCGGDGLGRGAGVCQ